MGWCKTSWNRRQFSLARAVLRGPDARVEEGPVLPACVLCVFAVYSTRDRHAVEGGGGAGANRRKRAMMLPGSLLRRDVARHLCVSLMATHGVMHGPLVFRFLVASILRTAVRVNKPQGKSSPRGRCTSGRPLFLHPTNQGTGRARLGLRWIEKRSAHASCTIFAGALGRTHLIAPRASMLALPAAVSIGAPRFSSRALSSAQFCDDGKGTFSSGWLRGPNSMFFGTMVLSTSDLCGLPYPNKTPC